MAHPAGLKRGALLALAVLAAHLVALQWFAWRLATPATVLKTMAPTMYTRLLQPQAPPAVAVAPAPPQPPSKQKTARVVKPRPAASAAEPPVALPAAPEAAPVAPAAEPPSATAPGEGTRDLAAEPNPLPQVVIGPTQPESAPPGDRWPADTRLSYRLGGEFRGGPLYGDARVLWQRVGDDYQVRIDIDLSPWATLAMTSQGRVSPEGLLPRAFEETRPGKRRGAQFGDTTLALEGGRTAPRPPGVQDTASQFVELGHRFATGREKLEVGRSISVWMARPGGLDHWTYDVVEREVLQLANVGPVEAFHLKPRPLANPRGNITAEMWFAPSLQYLPVRIKVLMGEEAYVDLLVEKIEQR